MLVVKNLHVSAGELEILRGVDLEVNAGEVHAIHCNVKAANIQERFIPGLGLAAHLAHSPFQAHLEQLTGFHRELEG